MVLLCVVEQHIKNSDEPSITLKLFNLSQCSYTHPAYFGLALKYSRHYFCQFFFIPLKTLKALSLVSLVVVEHNLHNTFLNILDTIGFLHLSINLAVQW